MGWGLRTRQWCQCFLWGRCRIRGGRRTSCARPAFPSPGLAVLAWTAFLEPRRRRPGACPTAFPTDALLCGESPLPSLTMRTSVLGHHPQDVAAWWPGAYMCLRGEHRALLLMILEMQSKHLLSHMYLTTDTEVQLSLTGPVGEGREWGLHLNWRGEGGFTSLGLSFSICQMGILILGLL